MTFQFSGLPVFSGEQVLGLASEEEKKNYRYSRIRSKLIKEIKTRLDNLGDNEPDNDKLEEIVNILIKS